MKKKLIIYIAGYGRSGSTVLNYKLSKYLSALSIGEIANVNREYYLDVNSKCSCKKKYTSCKLIKSFINKNKKKNIEIWYKKIMPQTDYLIRYFFYLYVKKIKKIRNVHLNKLEEIKKEFDIIDKFYPNAIIIDSSKSTLLTSNRPYILKKLGYEVVIIHIVKSFYLTFKSVKKGSDSFLKKRIKKEKSFRLLRFFINYFFSNIRALLLARNFHYIFIKNNDLLTRDSYVLERISKFVSKIVLNKKIKIKKTNDRHLVGGNRLKKHLEF